MSGFYQGVAGGNGNLIVTSLKSPNFDPSTGTGWSINKDGTATFNSVVLPNVHAGTTVTFSATAPSDPADGDVWYDTSAGLEANVWDGTEWVPYEIGTEAIADNAITQDLIADGAVGTDQIIASSITSSLIADQAVGTAQLAAGAVTSAVLASGAVGTEQIQAQAITSDLIADGAITGTQLADNAVGTANIVSGAITTALIADQAIGTEQIAPGSVTNALIAQAAVEAEQIADGAVGTSQLASGAALANIGSGGITSEYLASGVALANLGDGSITSAYLATGAALGNLSDASITAALLASGAALANVGTGGITSEYLAADAVTAGAIAANAVTAGTIAAGAVTSESIAADAVTAGMIASGAVTAGTIAAGAVTAGTIAAGAVTASDIAAGTITAEQISLTAGLSGGQIGSVDGSLIPSTAMNANPYFSGGDVTGWTSSAGSVETELTASVASGGPSYAYSAYATAAGASGYELQSPPVNPCTAGKPYMISAWVYTTETTVGLYATFTGASTIFNSATTTANQWNYVQTVVTAPTGATAIGAEFTSAAVSYWTACQIAPSVPGLLVAGELVGNTIVAEGAQGGYFLYSGTPAEGNLAVSVAPQAGTDAYGNAYGGGVVAYGKGDAYVGFGPFNSETLLALNPETGYNANGIEVTVPQIISESVNEGSSTEEYLGLGIFSGGPMNSSGVINTSALYLYGGSPDGTTNVPFMALFGDTTGRLIGEWGRGGINVYDAGGTAWEADVSQTSTNVVTNNNDGEAQLTTAWPVAANDPAVGTVYEIQTNFSGTMHGETLEFLPYVGTSIPAWSGGTTCGPAWIASGDGFTGWLTMKVVITAVGTSGTCDVFLYGSIGYNGTRSSGSNGNFLVLSGQVTGAAFNTTATNNLLCIYSIWGASASGQTITGRDDTFTRKGPAYS